MVTPLKNGGVTLAILLIAVMSLCQVLAGLCAMPPSVAMADMLQGDHGPMAMGETGACQASLPASPKAGGAAAASFAAAGTAPTIATPWPLLCTSSSSALLYPGESGPPLYARLSTFRI